MRNFCFQKVNLPNIATLALLIVTAISSCKDKEPIDYLNARDRVTEARSGKPLDSVRIRVLSYSDLEDTLYTDKNGMWSFKAPPQQPSGNNNDYAFVFEKDKYYKHVSKTYISYNDENWVDVSPALSPYAWIEIHAKNVNPFDDNDVLWAPLELGTSSESKYIGRNIDKRVIRLDYGNLEQRIWWSSTKNGIRKDSVYTTYLKAHDTLRYQIYY
jgi:hypothetical protein